MILGCTKNGSLNPLDYLNLVGISLVDFSDTHFPKIVSVLLNPTIHMFFISNL